MKSDPTAYCAWRYFEPDYVEGGLFDYLGTGGPFVMADLYTITLASGEVLRWADFDADIEHGGWSYVSTKSAVWRGNTRLVIGVEVDTLDINVSPRSHLTINGRGLLAAAVDGAFDSASIQLQRAFLGDDLRVIGSVIMFSGAAADVTIGRTAIEIRVNSDLERLAVQMPRNLYQAGCVHVLYSDACGVSRASQARGATVQVGSTRSAVCVSLSLPVNWLNLGYVQFMSGALVGVRRTIKQYASGALQLLTPLPAAPVAGDVVQVYPGCDKALKTCREKFNNERGFRGYPFIPVSETAV